MPTEAILDVKSLVKPVTRRYPAGTDLRADNSHDSPFYTIKDQRTKARAIERRLDYGEDNGESPRPNWRTILKLTPEVIAKQSKDLELVAYLIEALVRERGFAGLTEGFRLVSELVKTRWDHLYPMPDDEGIATRVAHIAGLNGVGGEGTLIRPILSVPLTAETSVGAFSYADIHHAKHLESLEPKAKEQRIAEGGTSMETIEQAFQETPRSFLVNLSKELTTCLEEYERMAALLDEKCGPDAPHTSNIRNALQMCVETLHYSAGNLEEEMSNNENEPVEFEASDSGTETAENCNSSFDGTIRTRQEAFAALKSVAEFFRRAEPHSPISYGADQLVRWGQTPLPELLAELVPDRNSRQHLFTLTGIQEPESE